MRSPRTKPSFTSLMAFTLAIALLYVVTYYLLVVPAEYGMMHAAEPDAVVAHYRCIPYKDEETLFGGVVYSGYSALLNHVFFPIHWVDRRVRTETWSIE